ncbi:MAG: hypothetical protein V1830_02095, partial [Candidatus Omnitrophota bacterium]
MKKKQIILIIILAVIAIVIVSVTLFFFRGAIITTMAGKIILKAGKPMQFGEYTLLIDKVEGNHLYGIKVSSKKGKFKAEKGDYLYLPKENAIKFNLIDGAADDYDPENPRQFHTLTFKQSYITIKL